MASTNEVKITPMFTDSTTRTFTIPVTSTAHLANVKTRIKQINTIYTGGDSSTIPASVQAYAADMRITFVSNDGAPVMNIAKGQIVQTEEEVIYDANS